MLVVVGLLMGNVFREMIDTGTNCIKKMSRQCIC